MPQPAASERSSNLAITRRILPAVAFTFAAYISIGIPLATLPTYAHLHLGMSTLMAGLLVSLQYIATFISRPQAGRMTDTVGPRSTVRLGMVFCGLSGLLILGAALTDHWTWASIACLALSRLTIGIGESLTGTGATMWAIGRVGSEHTAKCVSWNGVATYSALAIGAPIGVALTESLGLGMVGVVIFAVCAASFIGASRMAPTPTHPPERVSFGSLLVKTTPYGLGLALGGMGFGVIATFITLYFAQAGWHGAALSLSIYGFSFVAVRLLCAGLIDRYGGYKVAAVSFTVEGLGLLLLGYGASQSLAFAGSALVGIGFR